MASRSQRGGRLRRTLAGFRALRERLALPAAAKAELRRDRRGLSAEDPGIKRAIDEAVAWLGRAQDHSASGDGGVARHYSLVAGWSSSYPETTGYIVPTMLDYASWRGDEEARRRAEKMLDWLTSIQSADGGFQGGLIDCRPAVPVIFNTGQVLLGMARGVREFGETYREPMHRAANWLVANQDRDGSWRRHRTRFAVPGEKAFDTHVAWGLLEAALVGNRRPEWADAALSNVRWALGQQRENGWFDRCCLTDFDQPLTHTLGYALRGVVEAYRYTGDPDLLVASQRTADGLMSALRSDGFLPGRLDSAWRGTVSWACLTGTVQVSSCWLCLHRETGEVRYLEAALAANRYVRRTMRIDGAPPETRGAIKGSFPVTGRYCPYEYPAWAAKFLVDASFLELGLTEQEPGEENPSKGNE